MTSNDVALPLRRRGQGAGKEGRKEAVMMGNVQEKKNIEILPAENFQDIHAPAVS